MAVHVPVPAASILKVPDDDEFKRSYEKLHEYPKNLVYQTTYPAAIKAYTARLDEFAPKLFEKSGFKIPFRDYIGVGPNGGFDKQNVSNETELKERLGDLTSANPAGGLVTKKDPKCRFIFFHAIDSREPLQLNKSMLLCILTYHQVMSGFLDFLSIFGKKSQKDETRDLRYSGFHEQAIIRNPQRKHSVPNLGRSGEQYQMCYNLKTVVYKPKPNVALAKREWSIRQAAFHHQFDVKEGTTLWIVVHGREEIKTRVQDLTGDRGRLEDREFGTPAQCFRSSLAVHLLFCNWSTEGWRWYVQWLEEVVEEKTSHAIHERRVLGEDNYVYTSRDISSVQYYEDRTNEAIMILEANTDIMNSLCKFYRHLLQTREFPMRKACKEDIVAFTTQVDGMIYDSRMNIARAKVLAQITTNRKNLILQHLQSQATEKQSDATEKMERMTLSMLQIGTMAQEDTIAMRIITVVTLVFLPATFVSTFFSTDVVKYQNQQNGSTDGSTDSSLQSYMGSFSQVAMNRWLQVTLPLTALTLGIGYLMFRYSDKRAKRKLEKLGLLPHYEDEEVKGYKESNKINELKWVINCCS